MNDHMNKDVKILLIVVILLAVATVVTPWTILSLRPSPFPQERRFPPPEDIQGDIEFFYTLKTAVSTVNIVLIIVLLLNYINIYRKTRSEFTIGLIIFSLVFLMDTLVSSPLTVRAFGFREFGLGPFAMLPDFFRCIALAVLLYLSVKY
jgi:hypothetical protein